jgi:hypothetical protein
MTTGISQKGAFRRNVKWQLVGSASQAVLSGLLLFLMGRELETSGLGVFLIVMGYVYVANLLFGPRIQGVAAKQFSYFDLEIRASGDVYQSINLECICCGKS